MENTQRYGLDPAINLNMDHPNRPNYIVDRVNEAAQNNPAARNYINDIRRYLVVVRQDEQARRRNVDRMMNNNR